MTAMLEAALNYGREGIPVFPVGHTKAPLTPHGFKDATTDPEQIAEWWGGKFDGARIGVPTGKVSGWTVVDVDPRHGGDCALRELELVHGDLPPTPCQTTPGGGVHYIFAYEPALKTGANVLGPGLDVRNDGAYIIVAPSPGYDWDHDVFEEES